MICHRYNLLELNTHLIISDPRPNAQHSKFL
jgi:hypothetical protein